MSRLLFDFGLSQVRNYAERYLLHASKREMHLKSLDTLPNDLHQLDEALPAGSLANTAGFAFFVTNKPQPLKRCPNGENARSTAKV